VEAGLTMMPRFVRLADALRHALQHWAFEAQIAWWLIYKGECGLRTA